MDENVAAGVDAAELRTTLTDAGVPDTIAQREISEVMASPILAACRQAQAHARRLQMVLDLQQTHAAFAPEPTRLDMVEALDPETFYRVYYAGNRPFVWRKAAQTWPAMTRWTPDQLRARFEGVPFEVEIGREAAPNHEGHYVTMTFDAFIDRCLAVERSNDFYGVARNKNIARPAYHSLLDDIVADEGLYDVSNLAGSTSWWVGPRGTHTPFHHDTTNILFHQIYGTKRFRLVAPSETQLLEHVHGFYLMLPPQTLDARILEVTLDPGDALFIPAGWYHEAEAHSLSISFSNMAFRRPNDVSWYNPGKR